MVMLMVNLIQAEMTTQEFFADVIFRQNVKTKTKHFTMEFIQAEDFFRVIKERGIRSKDAEHPNLREFLQLNAENPNLLLVKNIRKTLEQMSQNEAFMAAIQEDVLMGEEQAREEAELERIQNGLDPNDTGDRQHDDDDEDYEQDQDHEHQRYDEDEEDDYEEDQEKLETVGEGNETNLVSTGENGGGLHNLRDADSLPDLKGARHKEGAHDDDDEDEDYAADGFEEKNNNEDDYEF